MSPALKILSVPVVFALLFSCAPHRPWDRSVPAAARTRWRLGQDIFASVSRDVKLIDPQASAQDFAVRRAAEAALLSITAHVRLPEDPARTRGLIRQLKKSGFTFAAEVLDRPSKPAASAEGFRLAVRDWTNLPGLPLTQAQVKAAPTGRLVRLIRMHLHDPSGAVAIWSLELASRITDGARQMTDGAGSEVSSLDCATWQQIAQSAVSTHSERVLAALWPGLRSACSLDELEAWVGSLQGALPEAVRLFGESAGFARRVRLCVTTGAVFPAPGLREAFLQLSAPSLEDLALGFLCSGTAFLAFSSPDPALEALRLHLSGKTGAAVALVSERAPGDTAEARLTAGRLAMSFGDRSAAAGHFRWAAAFADRPDLKKTAYFYLRMVSRITADEEWTALQEQFRLDPMATARELWLSGHWPALVLLSGRAPVPYAAEAARALRNYAACRPEGGALAPFWRRLVGPGNLQKVWPIPDDKTPCRAPRALPEPARPKAQEPWIPAWNGDFHSDLALLLHQAHSPAAWDAFFRRHAAHPQVTAAAELAVTLHPGSHRHGLAAARAFLLRGDAGRARSLLQVMSGSTPDRAGAALDHAELYLGTGFRHEAAVAMRDWFDWKEAFSGPQELDRPDWRLDANLKLVEFFWRAGFSDRAEERLNRLLSAARDGDPLRAARVAEHAARRFPAFASPETLVGLSGNPLFILQFSAGRSGFDKWRNHVLSQLAILLPDAPEVAWTACLWLRTGAACLEAEAMGVFPAPATGAAPSAVSHPVHGLRLPVLLSILDRLQPDTGGRAEDWRLALHAARFRARSEADWRFVEVELENE